MDRLSWIIQLGPNCNHKYPYKNKAEGGLTSAKEKTM